MVRRWRRNMEVSDDTAYVDMLTTLSEGSVRRNFNPYTDIDWEAPEFAVIPHDTRWILPATDPFGRHPWYKALPVERQIEIGMWSTRSGRPTGRRSTATACTRRSKSATTP
jgi:hypothetical protein